MQANNWAPEHSMALCEFLARGMVVFGDCQGDQRQIRDQRYAQCGDRPEQAHGTLGGPDPAEKRLERAPKAESAAPKLSKKPKRSKTVLVPEAPGLAPPPAVEPVKLALYRHPPAAGSLIELKPGDFAIPMAATRTASPSCFAAIRGGTARATARLHFRLTQGPGTASERAAGRILLRLVEAA